MLVVQYSRVTKPRGFTVHAQTAGNGGDLQAPLSKKTGRAIKASSVSRRNRVVEFLGPRFRSVD